LDGQKTATHAAAPGLNAVTDSALGAGKPEPFPCFTSPYEYVRNFSTKKEREKKAENMGIAQQQKEGVIEQFRLHQTDTGSPEVQVALLSQRIEHLTQHFKIHVKDHHSRRGLLQLVGQRRRLLDYLKQSDFERYQGLIQRLGIRK
jgi:small subunit ribosomal protein S15